MGHAARARQAAEAAQQIGPVFIGIPFSKIDVEARTVTGLVTDELLDRQNDVVDYETAKQFLTDDKLWPGNIREQHDARKPVGSKVAAMPNDGDKLVELTAYISEACPDTWTKVLDKTLKGFSIGGSGKRVVEKMGDKTINRLFLTSLAEVSLVDNPANPRALFAIAKSVDGAMKAIEPAGDETAVAKATALLDDLIEKAKKDDSKDDGKHKTASGEEGKWYAGTDGKSFPISNAKDVSNAARALGRTNQDKAKVKANIIRIAYAHGLESGLPEAWKKKEDQKDSEKVVRYVSFADADEAGKRVADLVSVIVLDSADKVQKGGPEPYDIDAALQAISFVNRLMSTEYWEARYAAAGASDGQKAQIAMLKAACDALLEFLQAEYEEQFQPDSAGPSVTPPLDLSDVLDDDDAIEMFATALSVIKVGARHSKGDVEMIQKVHDLSNSLGADCYTDTEKAVSLLTAAGYTVAKVTAGGGGAAGAGGHGAASTTVTVHGVGSTIGKAGDADDDEDEDCETCDGTGKIREGKVKCPDCDGTGIAKAAAVPTAAGDDATKALVDAAVQKMTAQFDTLKGETDALKATVSEKDKTIASLETRLKAMEDAPAGGGPVKNAAAVDKTMGPDSGNGGAADSEPQALIKSLQAIAEKSTDANVRSALAVEIARVGRVTGTSHITVVQPK